MTKSKRPLWFTPIRNILCGSNEFKNIVNRCEHPDIVEIIYQIITELECKQEGHKAVTIGFILTLMTKLTRLVHPKEGSGNINKKQGLAVISPALNYLSKNYYEQIEVEYLSKLCNMSVTHFRRLFNTVMETSPMEYLYHIRMKIAIILLDNFEYSITEIAMQVGYVNITSFNRHFKRIIGVTPREWRRK